MPARRDTICSWQGCDKDSCSFTTHGHRRCFQRVWSRNACASGPDELGVRCLVRAHGQRLHGYLTHCRLFLAAVRVVLRVLVSSFVCKPDMIRSMHRDDTRSDLSREGNCIERFVVDRHGGTGSGRYEAESWHALRYASCHHSACPLPQKESDHLLEDLNLGVETARAKPNALRSFVQAPAIQQSTFGPYNSPPCGWFF